MPSSPKISCFAHGKAPDNPVTTTIEAVVADIKCGKYRTRVEEIRRLTAAITSATEPDEKKRLEGLRSTAKVALPLVTFAGVFSRRANDCLLERSGFYCIDIDKLPPERFAQARRDLVMDAHVKALFASPSGDGLKVLFAGDQVRGLQASYEDASFHLAAHYGLQTDSAATAVAQGCFLSWDEHAFHNPEDVRPLPAAPEPEVLKRAEPKPVERPGSRLFGEDVPPGEDYDARGREHFFALLESRGWTRVTPDGRLWRRPGKTSEASATFDTIPSFPGQLYVFSDSTECGPLKGPAMFKPWAAFALLECGGDFSEAARKLRALGYSSRVKPPGPDLCLAADEPQGVAGSALATTTANLPGRVRDHRMSLDVLLSFDSSTDPDCVMGVRYLGRSDGLVIVAPSGVGKSVLSVGLGFCAALGRPFFGLRVTNPLRVLYVQAEDSLGDVAEAVQGYVRENPLSQDELARADANLRIERWNDVAGGAFLKRLRARHAEFPYDVVIINPLFSFCGCNVSEQAEMSQFLRNGLNPILNDVRAACVIVHHTNKPPLDGKGRPDSNTDVRYVGSGSAELTNWARAYIVLQPVKGAPEGVVKMRFAKRGNRAGVVDKGGKPTTAVTIQHSAKGLCWVSSDYLAERQAAGQFKPKFSLARACAAYDPAKSWDANEQAIALDQDLSRKTINRQKQAILEAWDTADAETVGFS